MGPGAAAHGPGNAGGSRGLCESPLPRGKNVPDSNRFSVSPHHQCQGTSGPRRNTESRTPNMAPRGHLGARPVLTSRPSATVPSGAT